MAVRPSVIELWESTFIRATPRPNPTDALFGEKSLSERFGSLKGRELLDKVFEYYQAIHMS